jgi:hypothetical protein
MDALYSGSGPKADQGFLTITDISTVDAARQIWPAENIPIPGFWSYCRTSKTLTGIIITGHHAEIWHWTSLNQPPKHLHTGPKRQAWYFPTLSPDGTKLAVITTPDRFYPALFNHPAQLFVFNLADWRPIGDPVSCLIESIAWQNDNKILHQDRHGRLVATSVDVKKNQIAKDGVFIEKRANNPRIQQQSGIIAARYGHHLHLITSDFQVTIVLDGLICDHGWSDDGRLFAVIDNGFWHCQLVWLNLNGWPDNGDASVIKTEKGAMNFTRLDQMVIL